MMVLSVALATMLSTLCPMVAPAPMPQQARHAVVPRPVNRDDPRPAFDENPLPPGMALPPGGRTPAPRPADLPRNGYVAGRFTQEGQWVDYTFEAEAGELSLFDFATWGYARSWRSVASIEILASDDTRVSSLERGGETAYRSFLLFVAPHDGVYRYRLRAKEETFRFTVVRHSDYELGAKGPRAFGDASVVHGQLADPSGFRTISLDLTAGEEVALRAANDHSLARKQKDNIRRRSGGGGAARMEAPARPSRGGREPAGGASDTAPPADFPDLVLQVFLDGLPVTEAAHFVLFTPEQDGTYVVQVRATSVGEGGLYVVELERAPPRVEVTGYVGDEEDDPVPGVTLRFLREPSSDPMGEATSDEQGEYRLTVLPGTYTVHVGREAGGPTERVQANIEQTRELNVVWTR